MGNRWGNIGNGVRLHFWGAPKSLQMVTAAMKLKDAYSLEGKMTNLGELQLQHHPSSEYSGLISFRIDWFDLLAVQ